MSSSGMPRGVTVHPFADKFPMIEGEEWERFKNSIKETKGNKMQPIVYRMVNGKMEIVEGRNRYKACRELKIKPTLKRISLPDDEVEEYIRRANLYRRHLNKDAQRAFMAAELRAEGKSTREIAAAIGVSPATVRNDLNSLPVEGGPNSPALPDKIVGSDGKVYRARGPKRERQPGEDPKDPKGKSGKAGFNWKAFEDAFSPLPRMVDAAARAYGEKKCAEHEEAHELLGKLLKLMRGWRARVGKPSAASA